MPVEVESYKPERESDGRWKPGQSGNSSGSNQWSDGHTPRQKFQRLVDAAVFREIEADPECAVDHAKCVIGALRFPFKENLELLKFSLGPGVLERAGLGGEDSPAPDEGDGESELAEFAARFDVQRPRRVGDNGSAELRSAVEVS